MNIDAINSTDTINRAIGNRGRCIFKSGSQHCTSRMQVSRYWRNGSRFSIPVRMSRIIELLSRFPAVWRPLKNSVSHFSAPRNGIASCPVAGSNSYTPVCTHRTAGGAHIARLHVGGATRLSSLLSLRPRFTCLLNSPGIGRRFRKDYIGSRDVSPASIRNQFRVIIRLPSYGDAGAQRR